MCNFDCFGQHGDYELLCNDCPVKASCKRKKQSETPLGQYRRKNYNYVKKKFPL